MHQSAFEKMAQCVRTYLPTGPLRVVDLGSRNLRNKSRTHRELFDTSTTEYIGVDVSPGANVDLVITKPYRLPLRSGDVDVVLSGQVFEHIPFFWVSMTEIARVLKPNGYAFITVPSRGHVHGAEDCWRFYPDSMGALAAWSGLELRDAFTDFPPSLGTTPRHDYAAIEPERYWGDTVGVFRKPEDYPRFQMAAVRLVTTTWANHVGRLDRSRRLRSRPARQIPRTPERSR